MGNRKALWVGPQMVFSTLALLPGGTGAEGGAAARHAPAHAARGTPESPAGRTDACPAPAGAVGRKEAAAGVQAVNREP